MRRQLERFLRGVERPPAGGAGNLGPSLRFHYLPDNDVNDPRNVESTEYANIVLSYARFYGQARAAGMPRPAPAELALLRQWTSRVLAGGWTHGGYLNWDSGLGFDRWHQAKKLGLTQQALLGVAQSPELQPSAAWGGWAKWMLDRSLAWYAAQRGGAGGFADAVFFGLSEVPQGVSSAALGAVRVQANAARAVEAGLGRMRGVAPPPMYAYDPDIGRLAITTPAYNTAIVAVNQHAFPYGGIELARLFDGDQRVVANIGGTGDAAFGVRVRDAAGRALLSSQTARAAVDPRVTPLRLTRAPSGVGATAADRRPRAYAGAVHGARGDGQRGRAAGAGDHDPPLHRDGHHDRVDDRRPARRRRAQRRRAVPELGPADRGGRRAPRRLARDRRARAAGRRRALRRGQRLRHRPARAAGRRRGATPAARAPVLPAASGSDAGRPHRARRPRAVRGAHHS